jgi:hypothetical protein
VPGQDGPHIEEDEMHPDISQELVAERIKEWRDRAARDWQLKDVTSGRHAVLAAAADLHRPWARLGRRPAIIAKDEHARAADHRSSGRRAA